MNALRRHLVEVALAVSEGREPPVNGYAVALALGGDCPEPASVFDRLVKAVRDRYAVTSADGMTAWLTTHGYRLDDESRRFWRIALTERVEALLDELLVRSVAA